MYVIFEQTHSHIDMQMYIIQAILRRHADAQYPAQVRKWVVNLRLRFSVNACLRKLALWYAQSKFRKWPYPDSISNKTYTLENVPPNCLYRWVMKHIDFFLDIYFFRNTLQNWTTFVEHGLIKYWGVRSDIDCIIMRLKGFLLFICKDLNIFCYVYLSKIFLEKKKIISKRSEFCPGGGGYFWIEKEPIWNNLIRAVIQ